jgi:hypothetical protein
MMDFIMNVAGMVASVSLAWIAISLQEIKEK